MDRIQINSSNARGILFVLGPSLAFSINDLVFKLLSDAYPLHQMIFIRSVVALGLCAAIIVPLQVVGPRSKHTVHCCIWSAEFSSLRQMSYYMLVLPLADTIACSVPPH